MRDRLVVAFELTLPDFFVAEVRLDAAAARFVVLLAAVRDLPAVLAAPRAEDREAVDLVERAVDFAAPRAGVRDVLAAVAFLLELRAVDFAAVLRAVLFAALLRAVLLAADFVDRLVDFDAAFAVDLEPVRAVDLAAVLRAPAVDFVERAVLFAAPREDDLAAVRVAPLLAEPLLAEPLFAEPLLAEPLRAELLLAAVPRFAEVERDEVPVDFAEDLRAVVPVLLAADFLAVVFVPLLRAEVVFDAAAFPPAEPRRAPLLLDRDVGRIASTAPVISWVSGFDLSSVGIAASFKGLRVQPSRLQGNVVIPSRFRLTESVESRTGTIPVDTFWRIRAGARYIGSRGHFAAACFREIFHNGFNDMSGTDQLERDAKFISTYQ